MKRRSFLKLLAASSAGIAFPSIASAATLGLNGKVAPSNRLCLGYMGIGFQGNGHFRGEGLTNPRIQVNALCEVDATRLNDALNSLKTAYGARTASGDYKGCFATKDFREMMARDDIDGVWISVPDHWHALPVITAAQAGKDIYCEKPLSLTISEGQAMVAAVQRSGVVCQIGSQQRSSDPFTRAVELVRNGFLGKITRVQVGFIPEGGDFVGTPCLPDPIPDGFDYDFWLGPAPETAYHKGRVFYNFRWNYDYSGGQLTDWIGHDFDIAAWAMQKTHTGPVAIKNATAHFVPNPIFNTPANFAFEAHYADGVVIEASTEIPFGIRIEGTEGWLNASRRGFDLSSRDLETVAIPSQGFKLTSHDHTSNFLDCMQSRETPVCPIDEGLRTVTVAHLANACFRTGRKELRWDPDKQVVLDAPDAESILTRAYRAPWQLPI